MSHIDTYTGRDSPSRSVSFAPHHSAKNFRAPATQKQWHEHLREGESPSSRKSPAVRAKSQQNIKQGRNSLDTNTFLGYAFATEPGKQERTSYTPAAVDMKTPEHSTEIKSLWKEADYHNVDKLLQEAENIRVQISSQNGQSPRHSIGTPTDIASRRKYLVAKVISRIQSTGTETDLSPQRSVTLETNSDNGVARHSATGRESRGSKYQTPEKKTPKTSYYTTEDYTEETYKARPIPMPEESRVMTEPTTTSPKPSYYEQQRKKKLENDLKDSREKYKKLEGMYKELLNSPTGSKQRGSSPNRETPDYKKKYEDLLLEFEAERAAYSHHTSNLHNGTTQAMETLQQRNQELEAELARWQSSQPEDHLAQLVSREFEEVKRRLERTEAQNQAIMEHLGIMRF